MDIFYFLKCTLSFVPSSLRDMSLSFPVHLSVSAELVLASFDWWCFDCFRLGVISAWWFPSAPSAQDVSQCVCRQLIQDLLSALVERKGDETWHDVGLSWNYNTNVGQHFHLWEICIGVGKREENTEEEERCCEITLFIVCVRECVITSKALCVSLFLIGQRCSGVYNKEELEFKSLTSDWLEATHLTAFVMVQIFETFSFIGEPERQWEKGEKKGRKSGREFCSEGFDESFYLAALL